MSEIGFQEDDAFSFPGVTKLVDEGPVWGISWLAMSQEGSSMASWFSSTGSGRWPSPSYEASTVYSKVGSPANMLQVTPQER